MRMWRYTQRLERRTKPGQCLLVWILKGVDNIISDYEVR